MGFFSDVFGAVAPVVGGALGGAPGAAIGGALAQALGSGGFAGGSTAAVPTPGGIIDVGFTMPPRPPVAAPSIPAMSKVPTAIEILNAGALAVTGLQVLRDLNLARRCSGLPAISAKKVRESARVCGLDLTAESFGLDLRTVCQIVASRPRRRRRGISAADLRRTRSTIRKVSTIRKDLKVLAR